MDENKYETLLENAVWRELEKEKIGTYFNPADITAKLNIPIQEVIITLDKFVEKGIVKSCKHDLSFAGYKIDEIPEFMRTSYRLSYDVQRNISEEVISLRKFIRKLEYLTLSVALLFTISACRLLNSSVSSEALFKTLVYERCLQEGDLDNDGKLSQTELEKLIWKK